jgi:hypothetical protein
MLSSDAPAQVGGGDMLDQPITFQAIVGSLDPSTENVSITQDGTWTKTVSANFVDPKTDTKKLSAAQLDTLAEKFKQWADLGFPVKVAGGVPVLAPGSFAFAFGAHKAAWFGGDVIAPTLQNLATFVQNPGAQ